MEKEDLYAVMDLSNGCTQGELKLAYKNLALKWHPDRFGKEIEKDEAKMKFQSIQRAYSVLSDSNKRLLYDVGAYDSDDDEIGMADFINEMVTMMAQTKSTGDESIEEFQKLFEELLEIDLKPLQTHSSSSSSVDYQQDLEAEMKDLEIKISNENLVLCYKQNSKNLRDDNNFNIICNKMCYKT